MSTEYLLVPFSSVSFIAVLQFSMCKSFHQLNLFLCIYSIQCNCKQNYFISLYHSSLLVYEKNRFLYIDFVSCNFTEFIYQFQKFFGTVQNFLPQWLSGKESTCSAEDIGSISESGRSPGEGNSNPLQSSRLGNPTDRGVWWATQSMGVQKSRTMTQ